MHSYAQTNDFQCPQCGRSFTAEIWLIVDAGERPDLIDRARAGELHAVACPACGPLGAVDAPLLIYFPDHNPATGQPPLIFSPAQQTTEAQDQQMATGLLRELAEQLGDIWQDDWVATAASVRRDLLPAALSDDPLAAMRDLLTREAGEERTVEAETWDERLPPAIAAALTEIAAALDAEGVRVESSDELARALAARPDLAAKLDDAMRAAMTADDGNFSDDADDDFGDDADDDLPNDDLPGSFGASGKVDDDPDADNPARTCRPPSTASSPPKRGTNRSASSRRTPNCWATKPTNASPWRWQNTPPTPTPCRCSPPTALCCAAAARPALPAPLPSRCCAPTALAEAERLGLAPEEFLAQMQAAQQQMPPALREVLAALAAEGVEIRKPGGPGGGAGHAARPCAQSWSRLRPRRVALPCRPNLRTTCARRRRASSATAAPATWPRSTPRPRRGSASLTHRALQPPMPVSAWPCSTMPAASSCAATGHAVDAGDLDRALGFWQQAVSLTPPDSPDLPSTSTTWATG